MFPLLTWRPCPLLTWRQAMKRGDMILVDELNLAEDAVLERLNRWGRGVGCALLGEQQ